MVADQPGVDTHKHTLNGHVDWGRYRPSDCPANRPGDRRLISFAEHDRGEL